MFLAVAAVCFAAAPAQAQQATTPQFRQVLFSRAPDDRTDTVVGPDAPQTIIRTGAQIQSRNKTNDDTDFIIRTDLPGPERLFDARKSETMMREFIRRDSGQGGYSRVIFPDYPPLSKTPYTGRQFEQSHTTVEPNYVCHGRLYFEQPNFERAGWDLGYITPAANVAVFYYDLVLFPYHQWTNPCVCYDCNAGKCMPGEATPFYLYREPFSVSGLAGQTLAVGGILFAFP